MPTVSIDSHSRLVNQTPDIEILHAATNVRRPRRQRFDLWNVTSPDSTSPVDSASLPLDMGTIISLSFD
jgi:hypothetical protein